jgi:hypothetical protein
MAEQDILIRVRLVDADHPVIWGEVRRVWPNAVRDGGHISDLLETLYYRDAETAAAWSKLPDSDRLPLGLIHQLWDDSSVTFVIDTDDAEAVTIVQNIHKRFG